MTDTQTKKKRKEREKERERKKLGLVGCAAYLRQRAPKKQGNLETQCIYFYTFEIKACGVQPFKEVLAGLTGRPLKGGVSGCSYVGGGDCSC